MDGKPCECKQEVVESIVTAECMKGTVRKANPPEVITDVNRTALLGGEPAERASGVDKGDEECDSELQPQQTEFYCEEIHQCNKNANTNIPNACGLPLEGEWLVYASSKMTNSNGDADALNAAVECVYGPSKSRVT